MDSRPMIVFNARLPWFQCSDTVESVGGMGKQQLARLFVGLSWANEFAHTSLG